MNLVRLFPTNGRNDFVSDSNLIDELSSLMKKLVSPEDTICSIFHG
jgi:hypothetical protein